MAVIGAPATTTGGSHAILRYRNQREHVAACARHVQAGVTAGAAVLVAATQEHLECLRRELPLDGSDVLMCDLSSRGADPGRVLSQIRMFARDNAGRPVRCVQDVGWHGRPREYLEEAIRYESLLGQALAGFPADVLCGYDAQVDADLLAAAEQAHPVAVDSTRRSASNSFAANATAHSLGRKLIGHTLSGPPEDAAALRFRDDQAQVRRFTAARARDAGLPADRVMDLVIAVGELAGNTLLHTNEAGTLAVWTTQDEIVCQVSDSGEIADPLAGTLRPDPDETGSRRGLWLVHQVSDLVQVRTGSSGTAIRVHMRLSV